MTTEGEMHDLVALGVDCIAPASGNVHGKYGPRGVVLEWDRYVWQPPVLKVVRSLTLQG